MSPLILAREQSASGTSIDATSGLSIYYVKWPNNTTGVNIKSTAGQIFGWSITNLAAAARHVKLYNKATAPTVGTDTPAMVLSLNANVTIPLPIGKDGIGFSTGIGIGVTTGIADSDTTAAAANDVIINIFYA